MFLLCLFSCVDRYSPASAEREGERKHNGFYLRTHSHHTITQVPLEELLDDLEALGLDDADRGGGGDEEMEEA